MSTIKFYRNYKNGRFYLSGKNEKDKWFYLNKSKDFNTDLYLDNDKFIKGLEIDKANLKLLEDTDNILVFKTAEVEKNYCIDKAEIEKRKADRSNKKRNIDDRLETLLLDCLKEIIALNSLQYSENGAIANLLKDTKVDTKEIEEIDNTDLPF